MQILRRVVAQCCRGERSIVNRRSRVFSSSSTNNNVSKTEDPYPLTELHCISGLYIAYKIVDTVKTCGDIWVAEKMKRDTYAEMGIKMGITAKINFIKPHKVTTWVYDVQNQKS